MGYFYIDGERLRWVLVGLAILLLLLLKMIIWFVYMCRKKRK